MAKDLAIVLNSGSINSAVVTALAAQKYRPVLLHAEMVAGGASRARAAYDQQVGHFKPYREHALPVPWEMAITGTSPSAAGELRQLTPVQERLTELMSLVSIAARFAHHYRANQIFLGLRVGPAADELSMATEYLQIWNELFQMPCGLSDLELNVPLLELDPPQVIDLGGQVAAPFDRTWSCHGEAIEPCMECRGCRDREQAFQQAGRPDPQRLARKA